MGPLQSYLISSASAFMSLTQSSQHLTPKPAIAVAMENVFGTPPGAIHVYKDDDSGIAPTPLQGTNVELKKRIWYHHSKMAHMYLSGKSLQELGTRFMELLSHNIAEDESIGTKWIERPDLYLFWQDQDFRSRAGRSLWAPPAAVERYVHARLLGVRGVYVDANDGVAEVDNSEELAGEREGVRGD